MGKTKELTELCQPPLLAGCIALHKINGGCSGKKATRMKKNKEQSSGKDSFSWSVFSGVSSSFRFLAQDFSRFGAHGMAESLSAFPSGDRCCDHSRHKGARQAWREERSWERGEDADVLITILVCFRDNNL